MPSAHILSGCPFGEFVYLLRYEKGMIIRLTVRRQVDMDDNLRIWRDFHLGSLFHLIMPDTRIPRDITDLMWNTDYVGKISNDTGRSAMGSRQENWFYRTLKTSSERGDAWRIVGSQIGMCFPSRRLYISSGRL